MADKIFGTTAGAVFIPEVWGSKVLVAREAYLVAAKVVERFDEEVAGFGDTIHVPEVSDLAATAVSEGTDVTYQTITQGEKTIIINKYYESSFLLHDKLSAQEKYRVSEKYAKKAAYALAKQMDTDILACYDGDGTTSVTNYVGDGSTAISKTNILAAIRILDGANVPMDDRHFIVDEYGKAQLFAIDDFVRYDATGKVSPSISGARQGYNFGELYGVTVHVSTNVPTESASPDVIHGMMLQREGIGLAVQKGIKVEKSRMPEKLSDIVTTQVLYGVSVLRADHIVDFRYKVI